MFYEYPNGDVYEGDWFDLIPGPHMKGTMNYGNGDQFIGEWLNASKHGRGIYTWADGSHYDGEWVRDNQEGHGLMLYADGSSYNGEWKNGIQFGLGTLVRADGVELTGTWDGDILCPGPATMKLANGVCYEGMWNGKVFEGYCVYTNKDGCRSICLLNAKGNNITMKQGTLMIAQDDTVSIARMGVLYVVQLYDHVKACKIITEMRKHKGGVCDVVKDFYDEAVAKGLAQLELLAKQEQERKAEKDGDVATTVGGQHALGEATVNTPLLSRTFGSR